MYKFIIKINNFKMKNILKLACGLFFLTNVFAQKSQQSMASALLELGQYSADSERTKYVNAAEKILRALSSSAYRAKLGQNGGFLLMHSVGYFLGKSEVDAPLTYADYYFLEALKRYKDWYLKK